MENRHDGFSRYLSRLDIGALSLACIIGWGAFVMPGTTFLPIAGPAGTAIAMAISAAIMGAIGINYSYLMEHHPGIGGVYAYTKSAFGRGHAFLSAWFLCLSYLALIPQNATALAVMFRAMFSDAIEQGIHYRIAGYDMYLTEAAIAVAVLVAVAILAILCKSFLQHILTGLAIVILAGVAGLACVVLAKVPLAELLSGPAFGMANPVAAILSIVVLAPWAFIGFEVISLETAHFSFPVAGTRKLILSAIAAGALVYVAMSLICVSVVPDGYASWLDYVLDLGNLRGIEALPAFNAAKELLGTAGLVLIGVTAVAAVLSSVIGFCRAANRILANMADDKVLNRFFSKPTLCFLFIMAISILVSFMGRRALSWVVDLSSFGAIVAFGYASAVVLKTARGNGDRGFIRWGVLGLAISVVFAARQLMPRLTVIEAMETESFLLLGLWCLLGFAFYWRTMLVSKGVETDSETITVSALFVLLFYSALVWYIKKLVGGVEGGLTAPVVIRYSVVFGVLALLGLLVMLLVASQIKRHQELLESERIRAVEGSKAKSQFLFNMSHDIRTPMNAIIGYTNLAMQGEIPEDTRDYLQKIETSSQHLLALINDILEMSRIESGKFDLELGPINICHIFDEMHDLFQHQMEQKGIDFTVHTAQVHHCYVWCDQNNLNRVLLNLIGNAYKFTPAGGSISASIWESISTEDDFGTYDLRVKDSGIGMSKEFCDKMFNAFERERTSTASGVEGTGLGLAITKSIIDLMGGTIEVVTSPGSGTEIVIRLRLQYARQEDVGEEEVEAAGAEESVDFTGMRLLLVEDNQINQEIASMILSQAGFVIETAEDGEAALDKVATSSPGHYDIILMDIQMPNMDGYEATRAIRSLGDERLSSVPIVAVTANAFREDEAAAKDAGMQAHIAKPLDIDQTLRTLARVLGAPDG